MSSYIKFLFHKYVVFTILININNLNQGIQLHMPICGFINVSYLLQSMLFTISDQIAYNYYLWRYIFIVINNNIFCKEITRVYVKLHVLRILNAALAPELQISRFL